MPEPAIFIFNPLGTLIDVAIGDKVQGVFSDITEWMIRAVFEVQSTLASWWTQIDTPTVSEWCTDADCSTSTTGAIEQMRGHMVWITMFVLVLTLLVSAAKMVWHRDGRPAMDALRAMLTTVLVSTAGIMLIDLLVRFSDRYSKWIINNATNGEGIEVEFELIPKTIALFFMASLLGLLVNIVMVLLMAGRSALLLLFAVTLPIAAASSGTAWGKQWFDKLTGWTLAFILFKPVAASIYAFSFFLIKGESDAGPMGLVMQMSMPIMAVLALPALIKLLVPATAGLSGGGSGGSASSVAGMAAAGMMRGGPKGAAVGVAAGAGGGK